MRTTARINIFILAAFLMLGLTTSGFGQDLSNHKPHGTNSNDVVTPDEDTDSVTVGSQLHYFVYRDLSGSTFTWNETQGFATLGGGNDSIQQVTWDTEGTTQLEVTEISSANCPDPTPTQIPVEVIGVPTIEFAAAGGSEDFCETGADGSLSVDPTPMDVNFTSEVSGTRQIEVTYDITGPTDFGTLTDQTATFDEGASTADIVNTLTHYGSYTITITNITDRISRKPVTNIAGSVNSTQNTFTVNVTQTPNTGTIHHLPNM